MKSIIYNSNFVKKTREKRALLGRPGSSRNLFSVPGIFEAFHVFFVDALEPVEPGGDQVWSLTQFYSVDFSQSRIGARKCFFNKRTFKVCVSCSRRCHSAPYLPVSLYLCNLQSNARGKGEGS